MISAVSHTHVRTICHSEKDFELVAQKLPNIILVLAADLFNLFIFRGSISKNNYHSHEFRVLHFLKMSCFSL